MPERDNSLPYQCTNYESILSLTSRLPESAEGLSEDAGCDTCFHYFNGACHFLSPNPEMDS